MVDANVGAGARLAEAFGRRIEGAAIGLPDNGFMALSNAASVSLAPSPSSEAWLAGTASRF